MNQPQRVRVTGPRRRTTARARSGDPADPAESPLAALYVRSLMRAQLASAARVVAVLVVTVGALPLAFRLLPGLTDVEVLGLPLPWVVLGVLVYPWLIVLGWWFVVRAERHERDYAALVAERER